MFKGEKNGFYFKEEIGESEVKRKGGLVIVNEIVLDKCSYRK